MSNPRPFVLDTSIVVHLIRNSGLGRHANEAYKLAESPLRPLICIVTHGELLSFATQHNWGEKKRDALTHLLGNLVTVDISAPEVLSAYAELDAASQARAGGARNMGKNDLWIAAVTRAVDGILITTDRDFDHLHPTMISREFIDPEPFKTSREA